MIVMEGGARYPYKAVDVLMAVDGAEEARRAMDQFGHLLNRISVHAHAEDAVDRLFRRGKYRDEQRVPDLIILDSDLIGEECYKVMRQITDMEDYRDAVVVILASKRENARRLGEQARLAEEAGAEWIAAKPLTMRALADILEDIEGQGLLVGREVRPEEER